MARKYIGILTAGGDCPGLNAAIRGVGKAAYALDMEVVGFLDGFRGLVENRTVRLDVNKLSGILSLGGTILGTSRDKPHKMPVGNGEVMNMIPMAVSNYERLHLDALVCLGGNGTAKNAYRLVKRGLNVMHLPKTIDNDVAGTDVTFGFDTALGIATEAIDRLHSTADSHHRVIVVEIMGHDAGWLALGSGVAGGADVILIPEIPYEPEVVVEALLDRYRRGKRFSIVAVAEGARSRAEVDREAEEGVVEPDGLTSSMRLVREIEERTQLEARVTVLGHLQRGGTPTAHDRLLASRLGTTCAELIDKDIYNVMVAVRGDACVPVPLKEVAGKLRTVSPDHAWVRSAVRLGTCLGAELGIK